MKRSLVILFLFSFICDHSKAQWCFNPPQQLMTNMFNFGISSADLNGDTKPDLVVAPYFSDSLLFYFNNGNGTFGAPVFMPLVNTSWPRFILPGDFDNNGTTDLIVGGRGGTYNCEMIKGNGSGNLSEFTGFLQSGDCFDGVTGYFDSDANLDWAVVNSNGQQMIVFLGDGNGSYWNMINYTTTGMTPWHICSGDFNNDGITDLAVADQGNINNSQRGVEIYVGNGNGTFNHTFQSLNFQPQQLVCIDYDHDGNKDLVIGKSYSVYRAHGNGDGTFNWTGPDISAYADANNLAAADIDNDGFMDLVVSGSSMVTMKGNGFGGFDSTWSVYNGNITYVTINDFNADGRKDIAAVRMTDPFTPVAYTDIYLSCINIGVDEHPEQTDVLTVFPSPTSGKADLCLKELSLTTGSRLDISIMNELGQEVFSQQNVPVSPDEIQIDISGLADGIYTLLLYSDPNKVYVTRIAKQ